MKRRTALILGALLLVTPIVAAAAGFVPCGGPDEPACQFCHFATMLSLISDWLVAILSIVMGILIITAGYRLVVSGGNPSEKEAAKKMITNGFVGFVIVLGAWLLINFVMSSLLSSSLSWNTIQCVAQPEVTRVTGRTNPSSSLSGMDGWSVGSAESMLADCNVTGIDSDGNPNAYDCGPKAAECSGIAGRPIESEDGSQVICTGTSGGTVDLSGLGQCNDNNGACSVLALTAAGLTDSQARVMSCIAMTESSGVPTVRSDSSSACGTFQILTGTWNGYVPSGSGCEGHAANCQNVSCNTLVMTEIVRRNGYNDWTCAGCNSKAQGCIDKYGG